MARALDDLGPDVRAEAPPAPAKHDRLAGAEARVVSVLLVRSRDPSMAYDATLSSDEIPNVAAPPRATAARFGGDLTELADGTWLGTCLCTLATVQLARGDAATALETARRVMGSGPSGWMLTATESTARLVLAEACTAVGDHAGALDAIRVAQERVHARAAGLDPELRATFYAAQENARTLALAAEWGLS